MMPSAAGSALPVRKGGREREASLAQNCAVSSCCMKSQKTNGHFLATKQKVTGMTKCTVKAELI